MAVQAEDVRLLANHGFRRLLEARAAGQIGQNAMLFTLLILIVDETDSSFYTTLLVAAFSVPSIILGLPAGALADVLPKRALLVVGWGMRAVLAALMIAYVDDVWTILLLVFTFSAVGQFIGPLESAALPGLVRRDQIAAGNSWLLLALMVGQAAGAVALAPFMLKLLGKEASLAVSAAALAGAAVLAFAVRGIRSGGEAEGVGRSRVGLWDAISAGWAVLRASRPAFLALVYLTVMATLAKALAVLAPRYSRDVLDIDTENSVFVVAPAAIGALAALLLTPPLVRWLGALRVAVAGFVLNVLSIAGLGAVVLIRDFLADNLDFGLPFVRQELDVPSLSVISMAMILAIPVGFAATMVGVAGKAVLNQEAPEGKQGRVFATQSALADAVSLLPLFAIGGVAELIGVREVLLVTAIVALVAGGYLSLSRRFGPPPQVRPAEAGQPTSS